MTILHHLKLIAPRFRWFISRQNSAIQYAEKIREWKSISALKAKVEQDILAEEKINENSDEIKLLKIKLGILNELI